MVAMAQSAANWHNTHTHMDRMHSVTHFTSTQLQPRFIKSKVLHSVHYGDHCDAFCVHR